MRHSIITPTYNREHLLASLYEHLKQLDYDTTEFEWVIVDDGSSDNTSGAVERFKRECVMNIQYIRQTNSGIHIAQNTAVKNARGTFITRIDSDDYLLRDSLRIKDKYLDGIEDDVKFAGVVGTTLNPDGSARCSILPRDVIDDTGIHLQRAYGSFGDRNFCIKRDVLASHLLPEHRDTKYIPESVMWKKIDRDFVTRFVNAPLSVCSNDSDDSMMKELLGRSRSRENYASTYYMAYYNIVDNYDLLTGREKLTSYAILMESGVRSGKHPSYSTALRSVRRNSLWAILLVPALVVRSLFTK